MTPLRTFSLLAVVMICGLSVVGNALAQSDDLANLPGSVKKTLFEAQELRKEGRFEESAAVIQSYLQEHPDHDGYLLRFQLGFSLAQANRKAEAIEHYEAAVRMNPDHAQAWLGLGNATYEAGNYERAGEAFHAGFKSSAEPDPKVLYYAGVAYLLAGKGSRSFDVLSELVSGTHGPPEPESWRAYVAAATEAGRLKECIKVLHDFISRDPEDLESWRLLYQAAGSMEDYRQAAVAMTVIDYLKPLETKELVQLADLYLTLNIPAKSTIYYERALGDTSSASLRERLASAYVASHDREKARVYLGRVVGETPTPRLWAMLGDLNYFDERYEAALRAYGSCAEIDPSPARAFLMMGYCANELDRPGDARVHARKAAEFEETRESAQRLLRSLDEPR